MRIPAPWSRATILIASLAACPSLALAHASGRGFVMLLPTEYYLIAGAISVAASFVLLAYAPDEPVKRAFREWKASFSLPRIEVILSLAALAFWTALVIIGLTGARDPLANPLSLTFWTLFWVGFTVLAGMFGNLWGALNPWSGLLHILGRSEPPFALPSNLGYLPAILGLLAFGWFELVYIAPDDPARLAKVVIGYWAFTLVAMLLFGEEAWRTRGEFLSVFFRFISLLAPIRCNRNGEKVELRLSLPGAGLVNNPAPSASGAVFILCALAIVSFDGLCRTFWWLAEIGINPLAFPGRSGVITQNTIGLLGTCAVFVAAFYICIWLGKNLAGNPDSGQTSKLALSIIPISLAYHFAHYLTTLMVNGQYALAAASDPLTRGDDWLNLGTYHVTTSFLNRTDTVERIWQIQSAAIILGHVLAVCLAHRISLDLWQISRKSVLCQLPLALLMVAYTVFGLWLLASPTGA